MGSHAVGMDVHNRSSDYMSIVVLMGGITGNGAVGVRWYCSESHNRGWFVVFAALAATVAQASSIGYVPSAVSSYSSSSTIQQHPTPLIAAPAVAYAAPAAHLAYAAPAAHLAYAAPVVAEQSAPAHYDFGYAVNDPYTGDSKSQVESRRGDVVQGSYSLLESDGTKRTVDYTADALNGFNAVVHKEPALTIAAAPVVAKAAPIVHAAPFVHAAPVLAYAAHHELARPCTTLTLPQCHIPAYQPQQLHIMLPQQSNILPQQSGDIKEQHENREGGVVKGSYSFVEADGTKRIVEYTADDHSGFNAIVHREGSPVVKAAVPAIAKYSAPVVAKLVILAAFVAVANAGVIGYEPHHPQHYSDATAVSYSSVSAPVAAYNTAPAIKYAAPAIKYSAPAIQYSAPAIQYSAPAIQYSAPAIKYSAPLVKYATPAAYVSSAHEEEHYAPAHYEFGYSVHDPHTGDVKNQHESREGDVVKGSYSFVEADGTKRIVEYTADKHNGFNAIVHREGSPVVKAAVPAIAKYSAPLVAKFVVLAAFVAVAHAGVIGYEPHHHQHYSDATAVSYSSVSAPVAVHHGHHAAYAAPVVKYAAPVVKYAAPVAYATPHHHEHEEHYAPAQYEFAYSVQDPHTGDSKEQHEHREGDAVHGSYSFVEADGTKRIVEYTADDHNGFNAVVHREGTPVVKAAVPVIAKYSAPLVAKFVVFAALATVARAGNIGLATYAAPAAYAAPAYAAHTYAAPAVAKVAYSAAPAVSYSSVSAPVAYAAHAPALATYAAPAAYAAPAYAAHTYAAPAYAAHTYAAPAIAKYAAPAHLSYAAPAISYAAPVAKAVAPVAYAAPVAKAIIAEQSAPAHYDFGYAVSDPHTGSYSLVESDGTRRIVEYTADPHNGFNAVVHKEPAQVAVKAVAPVVAKVATPVVAKVAAPVAYAAPAYGYAHAAPAYAAPALSYGAPLYHH
nr:unnamed protein product [Callosobruchus chinensis]